MITDGNKEPDMMSFFIGLFTNGLNIIQKNAGRIIQYERILMHECDMDCFSNFQKEKFLERFALNLMEKPDEVRLGSFS